MWRSLLTHLWQCNIRDLILTLWAYETASVFIKDNLGCGSVTCVKSELPAIACLKWGAVIPGISRKFHNNVLNVLF